MDTHNKTRENVHMKNARMEKNSKAGSNNLQIIPKFRVKQEIRQRKENSENLFHPLLLLK